MNEPTEIIITYKGLEGLVQWSREERKLLPLLWHDNKWTTVHKVITVDNITSLLTREGNNLSFDADEPCKAGIRTGSPPNYFHSKFYYDGYVTNVISEN